MAIINPLTYTIANGNSVDATPVQANFTQIVQDVNANAAPVGGNASQQFLVAPTANPAGAVPLAQAQQQFAALNGSASQQFAVANATASNQAVNLGQTNGLYASVSGNAAQPFAVANATATNQAVNLGQANSLYAPVAGNAAQTFAVANATAINQAVNLGQTNSLYAPVSGNAAQTFAVANATASNQAVNLGQLQSASVNTAGHLTGVQVTAPSRVLGTTYYNTTGYTMWVWVVCLTYDSGIVYSVVNGTTINNGFTPNSNTVSAFFVVPSGGSYQVNLSNGFIEAWIEWY
jgi:hypothetical protein